MKRGAWGWLVGLAAFVAYAVWLAPPDDPAFTRALVRGSLTGQLGSVDPAIAAVFTALGVVPVLTSTFVLRDGARRKLPAWPFALSMFVVGAFALLPWLALRHIGGPRVEARPPGAVRRLLARRGVGVGIVVALVGLAGWGLVAGSAAAYGRAFRTVSMVHVMTVDLVVCAALLFVLAEEARAGESAAAAHQESALARRLRFVPLLGTALWNALTPRGP
ncbi:hypothetical protein BH11MYX4_BH11MYX4_44970 [soil metagenome]